MSARGTPLARTTHGGQTALRDRFIDAMAELAAGVSVITTVEIDGRPVGATVTSAASASADPPVISVSMSRSSRTLASILHRNAFMLNVLRYSGRSAARTFASMSADKFAGIRAELTPQGLAWLPSVSAYAAACRVIAQVPAGDHLLLLGAVEEIYPDPTATGAGEAGDPIVYWRREYHTVGPMSRWSRLSESTRVNR